MVIRQVLALASIIILLGSPSILAIQSGPIAPTDKSTQAKYCISGTCNTGVITFNGTISANDTANIERHSHYPIIMIIPSELCTTAIKYNIKTDCPPLANIIKYDNSNQKISGHFYSPDGKIIERTNPEIKNHWMYYYNSPHTIVCVYCTGNYLTTDLYQTITLESNDFTFVPLTYQTVKQTVYSYNASGYPIPSWNFTFNEASSGLTAYSQRFVTPDCLTATIKYSDFLLNDTIHYLESGCKSTSFNKTSIEKVPNSPWSFNNPYSSLHYKAVVKTIKANHIGNCIKGCSVTTSTKKW